MTDPISPPPSDHDLLIRIDERTMVMQTQIIKYGENQNTQEKRIEVLEAWRANQEGKEAVLVRNAAFISSILASAISATIVFFLTRILKS